MVFNNKEGYIVPKKKKGPLKEVAWEEVRKKYKFYWVIFEVVTKKTNGDRDKVILHGKWKTRTGVYRAAARLARPSLKNNLSMEYIADPWDLPIQAFIASKKGGQEIKKKTRRWR